MNKVILIGRLGKDPEKKSTASGKAVCNFSLATSYKSNGTEVTEWHQIVAWEKQAELCAQYLAKGSRVAIEGEIKTRKWTDKNGAERYSTEIHARQVEFLTPKSARDGGAAPPARDGWEPAPASSQGDLDSDIPF